MNKIIHAAVAAGVDAILDEQSPTIKDDVVEHLITTMFSGKEIEENTKRLEDTVNELSQAFEKRPLRDTKLLGYLIEYLDIPRKQIDANLVHKLIANITTVIADSESEYSDIDFNSIPGNAIHLIKDDDDDTPTGNLIVLRVGDKRALVFLNNDDGLSCVSVVKTRNGSIFNPLEEYTLEKLAKTLTEIEDTEYAPPLMSDREVVKLDGLNREWTQEYLEKHSPRGEMSELNQIFNDMVNAYIEEYDVNAENKQIEIEDIEDIQTQVRLFVQDASNDTTPTVVDEDGIEEAVIIEDEPIIEPTREDDNLFSEGVVEQSEKTTAPEDQPIDTADKTTLEIAREIILSLGEDPKTGYDAINSSELDIKDSLFKTVMRTLSITENRNNDSYTDIEKENVRQLIDDNIKLVLGKIQAYTDELRKSEKLSRMYQEDHIASFIKDHPVHSVRVVKYRSIEEVADDVCEYLNNMDIEEVADKEYRILEILNLLSLYDYDKEALINPTYRNTNIPSAGNIIRATPVISTALRTMYTSNLISDTPLENKIIEILDDVYSGKLSALDLNQDQINAIINKLQAGTYARVGNYYTVIPHAQSNAPRHIVVILNAKSAVELRITKDRSRVEAVVTIDKANMRHSLLNLLTVK